MLTAASVRQGRLYRVWVGRVHHEYVADAPLGSQAVLEAVASRINSSVWRLPFIKSSPCPARINSTAFAAAAWLCGVSTASYLRDIDLVLTGHLAVRLRQRNPVDRARSAPPQPHRAATSHRKDAPRWPWPTARASPWRSTARISRSGLARGTDAALGRSGGLWHRKALSSLAATLRFRMPVPAARCGNRRNGRSFTFARNSHRVTLNKAPSNTFFFWACTSLDLLY